MTFPPQGGPQRPRDPNDPRDPQQGQQAHRPHGPGQGSGPEQHYGQNQNQNQNQGQGQGQQYAPGQQGQQGQGQQPAQHQQPSQYGQPFPQPGYPAASATPGANNAGQAGQTSQTGQFGTASGARSTPSAYGPGAHAASASDFGPGAGSGYDSGYGSGYATPNAAYGVPSATYGAPAPASSTQQGFGYQQPPVGYPGSATQGPGTQGPGVQGQQFGPGPGLAPAGKPKRNSRLLLILAIPAAALIAGLGGYFIGQSNGSVLAAEPLQAEVTRVLQDDFGLVEVTDVVCPEQVKADQGAEFQCTFTYAEQEQSVTVTVSSADGQVVVGAPE